MPARDDTTDSSSTSTPDSTASASDTSAQGSTGDTGTSSISDSASDTPSAADTTGPTTAADPGSTDTISGNPPSSETDTTGSTTTADPSSTDSTDTAGTAITSDSGDTSNGDDSTNTATPTDAGSTTLTGSTDSTQASGTGTQASSDDTSLTLVPVTPVTIAAADAPPASTSTPADATSSGGLPISVSDMITLGKAVADIMKDSKGTVGMKAEPVTVLPKGATPMDLTGFSASPSEINLTITWNHLFDVVAVSLPLVVQWHYNGQYNGHGRFINNANIFVDSNPDIGHGFTVDITAAFQSLQNMGTTTDPVPQLDIHIEIDIARPLLSTVHEVLEGSIRGDGSGHLQTRD